MTRLALIALLALTACTTHPAGAPAMCSSAICDGSAQ
jgi:hypothetical protein